jgi:hypothetical protein
MVDKDKLIRLLAYMEEQMDFYADDPAGVAYADCWEQLCDIVHPEAKLYDSGYSEQHPPKNTDK